MALRSGGIPTYPPWTSNSSPRCIRGHCRPGPRRTPKRRSRVRQCLKGTPVVFNIIGSKSRWVVAPTATTIGELGMSLVWPPPPYQPTGAARTHVFIVGVGRYRHLLNGADPKPNL